VHLPFTRKQKKLLKRGSAKEFLLDGLHVLEYERSVYNGRMQKIQNLSELAKTPLRKAALEIAEAGLQAIDTRKVVEEGLAKLNLPLDSSERLFVVGIGKCATQGVLALEKVLGAKITDGLVLDIQEGQFQKVRFLQGDHPFSTERDQEATKAIIAFLKQMTENDVVLFLISGGGSALLCQPEKHTCEHEEEIIKHLFTKGVAIQELNIVRKHLSLARGGYLAEYAYPAKVISLIFSDVPGNDVGVVSSGPTMFDKSTRDDAKEVLEKYGVGQYEKFLIETPKDKKYFEKVQNILFVSNRTALYAMAQKAKELGFEPHIKTAELTGEARDIAKELVEEMHEAPSKSVLLYGGETTVTVKKAGPPRLARESASAQGESGEAGEGGRNLELALSALKFVQGGELLLSFASDGRDNTEYAGAIADSVAKEHAAKKHLEVEEYLEENKSFSFFEETGDYVVTGNTGSNVSDLIIAIKE